MKTTILTLIFLLAFSQVKAQADLMDIPTMEKEFAASVAAENQRLQRRLLLNEAQFVTVAEINTERNERIRQVQAMYGKNAEKLTEKLLELELQFDAELEHVLTMNQFKDYLAMHGRRYNPDGPTAVMATEVAVTTEQPAKATFNDRIHALLKEAQTVKIDSSLIARQDSSGFEMLSDDEELALNGLKPMNATLMQMLTDSAAKAETLAKATQKPARGIKKSPENIVQPEISQENYKTETIAGEEPKTDSEVAETVAEAALKPEGEASKTVAKTAPKPETDVAETIAGSLETEVFEEKTVAGTTKDANGECLSCFDVLPADSLKTKGKPVALKTAKKAAASPKLAEEWTEPADTFIETPQNTNPKENEETMDAQEEKPAGTPKNENSLALPADEIAKLRDSLKNGTENSEKTAPKENEENEENEKPALNTNLPVKNALAEDIEP